MTSRLLPSLGLRFMLASAFFFAVMSALVKLAGEQMPTTQIVLARSAVALVMSWLWLRRIGVEPWGVRRGLLLLRGLLGFGGLSCFFYALTHLPLGDATVIQYSNPVFVALLAALFLGEGIGAWEILGAAGCLVGVALMMRPSFLFGQVEGTAALDPLAVGVALGGAVISAAAYTLVRKLRQSDHPMVVVFYFPLVATPLALPAALPEAVWPTWTGWLLLLGVGACAQIAQIFLTRGLHLERAGRAMAVSYMQVVFAFLFGLLAFGERPTATTLGGAALVVASVLLVARRRQSQPREGTAEEETATAAPPE